MIIKRPDRCGEADRDAGQAPAVCANSGATQTKAYRGNVVVTRAALHGSGCKEGQRSAEQCKVAVVRRREASSLAVTSKADLILLCCKLPEPRSAASKLRSVRPVTRS